MKEYEWWNKIKNTNESIEVQALGLVLDDIDEIYGKSVNVEMHKKDFERYMKLLNEKSHN